MKKLHENRHLFSVLGNSKPRLKKAMFTYGIDSEFMNPLSELCLNSTEGKVQMPEVVKQQTKQFTCTCPSLQKRKKMF